MARHHHLQIDGFEAYFKGFWEAGGRSLLELEGARLYAWGGEGLVNDYLDEVLLEELSVQDELEVLGLRPGDAARGVVAIDSSSVKVAEGARGAVAAVRGALVARSPEEGLWAEVVGPFLFYISRETLGEILGEALKEPSFTGGHGLYTSVQKVLAGLLEKRLQEYAAERFRDSIILFDGSLTAGPLDNPTHLVRRILGKAPRRGNDIIAFSKTSLLRIFGEPLQVVRVGRRPPYVIDVTWAARRLEPRIRVMGKVYLARLAEGCPGYRVDAHTRGGVIQVFGELLSSDPLIYGYPESLVLAHDYATFTKLDVIGLQSILEKMDVQLLQPDSIRDMLFNPLDGEPKR